MGERVAVRDEKDRRRLEEKLERAAKAARAKEELQGRLTSLAASVAPVVNADPRRVLQTTEALVLRQEAEENEPFLGNPTGYSDARIFKDPRARLQVALSNAGLLHHAVARDVIRNAGPTLRPCPFA